MKNLLLLAILLTTINAQEIIHSETIPIQRLASDPYLGGKKDDFVARQKELIQGKSLKLWGVGLFSGTDPFSFGIKLVTSSKISHVGLILEDENSIKYSYESTGSAADVLRGLLPQVQIHLWDDVVTNYTGKIYQRQFAFTEPDRNDPKVITPYIFNHIGKPYEKDLINLISAVTRGNVKGTPDSVFCSEETARFLINLKYLDPERIADNYLPKDFTSKEYIPLIGCSLGKQTQVSDKGGNCCIIV